MTAAAHWIRDDQRTTLRRMLVARSPYGGTITDKTRARWIDRFITATAGRLPADLLARLSTADLDAWIAGRPELDGSPGGDYYAAREASARFVRGTLTRWLAAGVEELEARIADADDLDTLAARLAAQAEAETAAERARALAAQAPSLALWGTVLAAEALAAWILWRRRNA